MRRALCVLAILPLLGCGMKTKPVLVTADLWAYRADAGAVATEAILADQGVITPARSREILRVAQPVAQLGLQVTRVLRAWQPGAPMPDQLPELVAQLADLVRLVVQLLPQAQAQPILDAPRVTPRGDLDETLDRLVEDWTALLEEIAARLTILGGEGLGRGVRPPPQVGDVARPGDRSSSVSHGRQVSDARQHVPAPLGDDRPVLPSDRIV